MDIHHNFVMFYNLLIWQMLTTPYCSRLMAMGMGESSGQSTSKCSSDTFRAHCRSVPGQVELILTHIGGPDDNTKGDCSTNQTRVYECNDQMKTMWLSLQIGSRTIFKCFADRRNVCTWTFKDKEITNHSYPDDLKFICTIETDIQLINVSTWVCSEVSGNISERTPTPDTTTIANNFSPNNKTAVKGNNSEDIAEVPYMWIIVGTLITILIIVISVAVYCYKKTQQQIRNITNEIRVMPYNKNGSTSSSEDHTYVNREGQSHKPTPTQAKCYVIDISRP